ncbi:toll/interleukin-1 receptor domain-containing protein [Alkalinema pantanalense CENA528]|uniref:toll/interleukin-1 receptor domain-containing protein n=1 Tax=Alkalinema pantanalense TaxID=1620705 RepID=UPI003D6DD17A
MVNVKVEIFLSYSHQDQDLCDQLQEHLTPLERQGKIIIWHNRLIEPGQERRKEIDSRLNSADIILLLTSSSFVASEFCYCNELEQARKRHDAGEARMIPIFLRPLDIDALEGTPLHSLQGLPEPNNPIVGWEDRDQALTYVAKEIRKVVIEIQQSKQDQQATEASDHQSSLIRSQVADKYYIQREEAKKLLESFDLALQRPQESPFLFNIVGIGGVGKTTLLGRLKASHADKVDFLEVCFAKTYDLETPLKLMRKLHRQALSILGAERENDAFAQRDRDFETVLFQLSHQSINSEPASTEDSRKITSWFERLIWLSSNSLTTIPNKTTAFSETGQVLPSLITVEEDTENLKDWIEQRVRNHPATKDNPELQMLMLEPVARLTQAFAESLIQISHNRGRSLVLILDTYEKAQPYLNQWLWQYLVEDTILFSTPIRVVVLGRKSLQTDEGWRKLNQDRNLLCEIQLPKFSKKDTETYLQRIGIENVGKWAKIHKVTQGLPYYLDWVRRQEEQGDELDFSKGNQAIAELLFQGLDAYQQKVLQVVACCRWFDPAMIQYLLDSDLGWEKNTNSLGNHFEWLKQSDFVEFSKGHYRLDDIARDVFRRFYFHNDRNQFRKTNALLSEYFKQQADNIAIPQSPFPDIYEDEEWRELIAESLYYALFGKGREGLQQYIDQIFTGAYLREPDIFMVPFAAISAEINTENDHLLPHVTNQFFKEARIALILGWLFLGRFPKSYKLKFANEENLSKNEIESRLQKLENSLNSLLEHVDRLQDGFGKCIGLMYKALRCKTTKERCILLLNAKNNLEIQLDYCTKKLSFKIFSQIGELLISTQSYEDALDCYQKTLNFSQEDFSTLLGYSQVLINFERYEEALQSVERAIGIKPNFFKAWGLKAACLCGIERYEEALQSVEKAIEIEPKSAETWKIHGLTLVKLERYEEALKSVEKTIEIEPKSAETWKIHGFVLMQLERYEEALKSIEKAIRIEPSSTEAWNIKVSILIDLRSYQEAISTIDKAPESAPIRARVSASQTLLTTRGGVFTRVGQRSG